MILDQIGEGQLNKEVNLTKRIWDERATDRKGNPSPGYRFCPVVLSTNGRVKPDFVLVDGRQERHPEGAYYLEWYEGKKRRRLSVGNDASEATTQRLRKEAELNAVNHGIIAAPSNGNGHSGQNGNGHRALSAAVWKYLEGIERDKKPRTYWSYKNTLEYFLEFCKKPNLEDITRDDLLNFSAFLREKHKQTQRTIANKFTHVISFLKAYKIRAADLDE